MSRRSLDGPGVRARLAALGAGPRARWGRLLAEAAAMISPLVVSDLVGRLAPASASTALAHAAQIAQLERRLGVAVEHWFSAAATAHPVLHATASGYYASVHVAGTALAASTLALARPAEWVRMRTAFLVASGTALVISRVWPVMPPNLAGPGIGLAGAALPASHPPNAYAAMPSTHTVWALWTAAALVVATRHARPPVRWAAAGLGGAHIAVTIGIVFGLGHHFLADVLAGVVVTAAAAGAAALVLALSSRRRKRARTSGKTGGRAGPTKALPRALTAAR